MQIIRKSDRTEFISQDKAIVKEIASPDDSAVKRFSMAEVRLLTGNSVLEHHHVESEELFYILQGKGLIAVDGEIDAACEGDAFIVKPGMNHKITNQGNEELIMLVVCSPAYRDEDQVFPV